MAGKTKIEWTGPGGKTWNPLAGCSVMSPGCKNCYAANMARRLEAMADAHLARTGEPGPLDHYRGTTTSVVKPERTIPLWTGAVHLASQNILLAPLRWPKATTIFVNSMSDLFHENVTDEQIDQIFAVMALCPQHTFQILTKREKRMRRYIENASLALDASLGSKISSIAATLPLKDRKYQWPLPNVWLGVSVEDQARADERISWLLGTPAAARFLSCEPLLGPVSLRRVPFIDGDPKNARDALTGFSYMFAKGEGARADQIIEFQTPRMPSIDWVIVGGESGPEARPMHPDWARQLRDECVAAGVPFFFKQWGAWAPYPMDGSSREWMILDSGGGLDLPDHRTPDESGGECAVVHLGKAAAGRTLDGQIWDQMPAGAVNG